MKNEIRVSRGTGLPHPSAKRPCRIQAAANHAEAMISRKSRRPLRGVVTVENSVEGKCSRPCSACASSMMREFARNGRGKMLRIQFTNERGKVVTETLTRVLKSCKPSSGNKSWTFR